MDYTANYQLPVWAETDRILMDDFNDLTETIDEALTELSAFRVETGTYVGTGGITGTLIGPGGSLLVGRLMFQMTIYPAAWITLCAFTLSVALGILFGIYPAAKAARLQPVEALRAE